MAAGKRGYRKRRGTKMPRKTAVVKITPGLRRAVNAIVSAKAEDKIAQFRFPPTTGLLTARVQGPINAFASDESSFVSVLPLIPQGVESDQRVGDKISVKSCYIDLLVSMAGTNLASDDLYLRVLLTTDRAIHSYYEASNSGLPSNVDYSQLMDLGGGSYNQFQGFARDVLLPINRNQFVVHFDKVVHLQKAIGQNTNAGVTGTISSQNGNNTYKARIKVPLPKVLKYNLNTDGWPANAAPMLSLGYAHVDNTIPASALTVCYTAVSYLRYEDI